MNEQEWARLIGDVIRGVDPEDADVRRRVHCRMEDDGTLAVLRRAALAGGNRVALVQILRCLALPVASEERLKN